LTRRTAQLVLLPLGLAVAGGTGGYVAWLASADDPPPPVAAEPPPTRPDPPLTDRGEARPEKERSAVDARPDPAPRVPARPPRIEIPAIDVRAHAIPLATDAESRLEVPTNWSEVGWWDGGPTPGRRGAAVVVGHVDSKTGPAVFHRLRELRPGDEIRFVARDRSVARFVVERTASHPKKSFPTRDVYGDTTSPALRLVTCDGDFDWESGHYRSNLIVFARAA
jgi:sortase (surface protein transpeptidase)